MPPKVLCKNLCGKSYLQTSKKSKTIHEKSCKWAWGPGEDTGVPKMVPEIPTAVGVTGMDMIMEIAGGDE